MKKLHLLSGMMLLAAVATIKADDVYPGGITAGQARKIEEVQQGKLVRQQKLARPAVYKMIDPLIINKERVDWPAIFSVLDSMKGVINVNEYRTPSYGISGSIEMAATLLMHAVNQDNFLAAKILLEKYKANPNIGDLGGFSSLMLACYDHKLTMINLLMKHGGNPYLKHADGNDCFDYAQGDDEVLKILKEFKQ